MSQMSVTTAPLRPSRRTAPPRPDLHVVPTRAPATAAPRRLPFVLFCSFLLAAGLMALLFINMSLAQGAYTLYDLERQSTTLSQDEALLREQLAQLESPAHLSQAAERIGMVPGTPPAFLDVSDRSVIGEPSAAPTPEADDAAAGAATDGAAGAADENTGSGGH
ncbi:MAG: hypothetical protein Q4G43_10980 [Mobilicoccus sp.]|nr:hypothetical protein [Mobilicoccus sp.]